MKQEAVEILAKDFVRWGKEAVLRVQKCTKKYGTQFGAYKTGVDG